MVISLFLINFVIVYQSRLHHLQFQFENVQFLLLNSL